MNFFRAIAWLVFLAIFSATAQVSTNRPANWARPLKLSGVANFFEVTTNLYRGAQPTADGMKRLRAMGIKTVINLHVFNSEADRAAAAGLKDLPLEMTPWHMDDKEVVAFLKMAVNTNNFPVFVHCERGADRTGAMCAMYRIVVCDWTKQQALEEMKEGGFAFSPVWQNLVSYIEKADIADIRRRTGLPEK